MCKLEWNRVKGGWERLRDNIIEAGREICGETTGKFSRKREAWWWNETVQQVIREKKEAYKKWRRYRTVKHTSRKRDRPRGR